MAESSRKQAARKPAPGASQAGSERAKPLRGRPGNRGRQVVRQLTLLRAIEGARRGLTIAQLHELLDEPCNVRTVYRDVEQLQLAGFPLVETEGRWQVMRPEGSTGLQAFPLQPSEVLALLLSEDLLTPLGDGGIAQTHRELRRRLTAHLSPEGRALVNEMRQSVRATHAAPPLVGAEASVLNAIEDAYECEQCLRITYAAPGKEATERVVEPHLLWVHAGRPYLVAYCRSAGDFRSFALQRMRSAEMLDESFDRRTEFNAQEFVQRGFGVLHGELHAIVIEFSAEVAHLAEERRFHVSQQVSIEADGHAVLRMSASGLPEVAAWVASFGGKVRALAPAELVEAVRALHEGGLAAHAGGAIAADDEQGPAAGISGKLGSLTSGVKDGSYGGGVESNLPAQLSLRPRNGDA
jgi:predicted DNA-binding transcriptional regulator YafY